MYKMVEISTNVTIMPKCHKNGLFPASAAWMDIDSSAAVDAILVKNVVRFLTRLDK